MINQLNLDDMGLVEMNQTEIEEIKGGGFFGALLGAVVGAIVGLFTDVTYDPPGGGGASFAAGSSNAVLLCAAIGAYFGGKYLPF